MQINRMETKVTGNRYKVLIIEDEANIRNIVRTILVANEYQVLEAQNAKEGKMMFLSYLPDVILLDLGLPDRDGIELIREIREGSTIPIIVLSARTDEYDKVDALDGGANDYMTKPFSTAELVARVRVALRVRHIKLNESMEGGRRFCINDLEIDYESRKVAVKGQEVRLTQTEYNILSYLAVHAGRVMTYSEIIREIWGWNDVGSVKKLQVNMANIRKKLGQKPGDSQYIQNELGVGYRVNSDSL